MCKATEKFEAAYEVKVGRKEGKCDAVGESEHTIVFVAGCLLGEERARVDGEGTDEGETMLEGNGGVQRFFELHHDHASESEDAASDRDVSLPAELPEFMER